MMRGERIPISVRVFSRSVRWVMWLPQYPVASVLFAIGAVALRRNVPWTIAMLSGSVMFAVLGVVVLAVRREMPGIEDPYPIDEE